MTRGQRRRWEGNSVSFILIKFELGDDDKVMLKDILRTSCDQCRRMVQYSFTSTETRRLIRTDSPGRPPRLSHSSWTMTSWFLHTHAFMSSVHDCRSRVRLCTWFGGVDFWSWVSAKSDEQWNCFKGSVGKMSGIRRGAYMGFSERIDKIVKWTETVEAWRETHSNSF